ncbi:hypothetical protein BS78_05G276100 [Paspalum vaginatum]|nr:hypothetical protein BS78_05G276100 [Paspalum vaginatum]KAJ1277191.1 hypothetical protein BS78_05G276100 [Paspalum vaginatum]
MASSNGGQHSPQRTLIVSKSGAKEDHTFDSYIEKLKDPHCKQPYVVMHPVLLKPIFCSHCRRWVRQEDLSTPAKDRLSSDSPADIEQELPVRRANDLALEGRSCLSCAQEICKMTRYLQDPAPASWGGDTPLHQAAVSRNLPIFCHLITLVGKENGGHGLAVLALRKTNDRKETALHVAIRTGDRDMVELMLWVDPQLAQIECHDTSAIYLAVSLGRKDIAEALHDASSATCSVVSYSGPSDQNALHAAVLHGGAMTKEVLRWNPDLVTRQDRNGSSPLHFAVSVVQGPYVVVTLCGKRHVYGEKNQPTRQLLDADSSMAYREDNEGLFPVHIAAMGNHTVSILILLRRCPGCMGLRDRQGRTLLHVAVQNKASIVVRGVCESERFAPILNIRDKDGNTALHLAVDAQDIWMVCVLLRNRAVCLELSNMKGQTALDVAKSRIRQGFFYAGNPDKEIYKTLVTLGAKHGTLNWDRLVKNRIPQPGGPKADDDEHARKEADKLLEKEESDKLTSSTQTLGIGSVLIATVTFGASFALPGGNIADGSPTLAGKWYFDAFVVANTLAFICSSAAIVGLMYSGMAMVTLPFRRFHFNTSLFFASSSVTCLTAAFALGIYLLLAPVARSTAILICAICPLVLIYKNMEFLRGRALVSVPMRRRRGFRVWLVSTARLVLFGLVVELWPFAVIFGWAGHLRQRRHG